MINELLEIRILNLSRNEINFTLIGEVDDVSKEDFFIYQNNTRLKDQEFDLLLNSGKYYIIPHVPFNNFTTVSFFIKNDIIISNIIYIYYSLADIVDPNTYASSYLFLSAIIPNEIISGMFNFTALTFNGLNPPSNIVEINIVKGISTELSSISFIETLNNYNRYNISLYDTDGSIVPNGEYTVKCYINK